MSLILGYILIAVIVGLVNTIRDRHEYSRLPTRIFKIAAMFVCVGLLWPLHAAIAVIRDESASV